MSFAFAVTPPSLTVTDRSGTATTFTVIVPVLLNAVPSLTWNPNVVYGEPFPFSTGVKTRLPRLATGTT